MALKPVGIFLLLGCGILVSSQALSTAGTKKKTEKNDPAARTVEKVLRAEVAGQVDRREQLADTLQAQPDSAAARGQAGFVRNGKQWVRFEDFSPMVPPSESLSAYLEQRARTPRTAVDQLKLADWCRSRKLPDQERSHLFAALTLDAGGAAEQIAQRLGYRQIAGHWLSPEQLLEWRETNERAEQSLKKWESQLTKLADRLAGLPAQRELYLARLKKTADKSAIPAIEYVLCGRDEKIALDAVEMLRPMDDFEASQALARQAVFSPWGAVRESASEALRCRPLDHFVPDLLGLLSTPITSDLQVFRCWETPGALYYNLILSQETQNQFQVAVLSTFGHVIHNDTEFSIGKRTKRINFVNSVLRPSNAPLAMTDLDRVVRDGLRPREDAVVRQNELVTELNGRVSRLLGIVSGQAAMTLPQDWWLWWAEYSDVEYGAPKRIAVVTEEEDFVLPTSSIHIYYDPSCFAAGTPVWTDSGLRSIESIGVGDRVLAKHAESGELEYKPVLQTTVRPPHGIVTLRIGDERIACTGGHRFWVSGEGWLKARDLKSQTLLHTVTGNAPIWSVKQDQSAVTYNLVVADFHTYFVGEAGVLCQDLLAPKRTNSLVPGLARK